VIEGTPLCPHEDAEGDLEDPNLPKQVDAHENIELALTQI
jgi:hypothetical protein